MSSELGCNVDRPTTSCRRCRSGFLLCEQASSTGDLPSASAARPACRRDSARCGQMPLTMLGTRSGCPRRIAQSNASPPVRASSRASCAAISRRAHACPSTLSWRSRQPARLLVAVDPDFERIRRAVFHVPDENREAAETAIRPCRSTPHCPRRAPAGPASAGSGARLGRRIEENAAVGVGRVEIVRFRVAGIEVTDSTLPTLNSGGTVGCL